MQSNYSKLIDLLNKAKGDRSLNQFAQQSKLDAGHLSRVLRGKMGQPPAPDTLKKIADKAYNGVTYEELMTAAGHLEKKFVGKNFAVLRGERTYEEYSKYLGEKSGMYFSPQLLERCEKGLEKPDKSLIDYIISVEGLTDDFFYLALNEEIIKNTEFKVIHTTNLNFMDKETEQWVKNPDNYPYIKFIYKAFKSGISKELLEKAEITIKIN